MLPYFIIILFQQMFISSVKIFFIVLVNYTNPGYIKIGFYIYAYLYTHIYRKISTGWHVYC